MQNYKSKFKTDLRQRSFEFGLKTIQLMDTLPSKRSSWVISDQLIRSSTSIGANIVEAKASSSRLEFKKFFEIALKSANESEYWLNLLARASLTREENITPLLLELSEISKMIAASVISLKKQKF